MVPLMIIDVIDMEYTYFVSEYKTKVWIIHKCALFKTIDSNDPTCISLDLTDMPLLSITDNIYIASRLPRHADCFSTGTAFLTFRKPFSCK